MRPTLGQIVHYRLDKDDLSAANKGHKKGEKMEAGESLAAIVTSTAGQDSQIPFPAVSLTVFAPNGETFGVTGKLEDRNNEKIPGSWQWPVRAN